MKTTLTVIIVIFLIGVVVSLFSFLAGKSGIGGKGGLSGQGILFSEDNGSSWNALKGFGGENVREFIISKTRYFYAGTLKSGLWIGDQEKGEWSQVSLLGSSRVYDIIEDPLEEGALYLAVFQKNRGRLFRYNIVQNSLLELYFTPLERYAVFGVSLNPLNPRVVWLISSDGGFYESGDRGKNWRVIKRFKEGLVDLVDDKRRSGHLWVVTSRGNIFETFDSGRTWSDVSAGLRNFPGANDIEDLVFNETSGALYLASRYGLLRSLNGGKNWESLSLPIPSEISVTRTVAINPNNPRQIYASSGNQIYTSDDGGFSWRGVNLPTKYAVSRVVIDPKNTKIIYAGIER